MNILSFPHQGLPTSVNNKCTRIIQDPLKSTSVPQKICAISQTLCCLAQLHVSTAGEGEIQVSPKYICEKKVWLEMSGRGKGSEEK